MDQVPLRAGLGDRHGRRGPGHRADRAAVRRGQPHLLQRRAVPLPVSRGTRRRGRDRQLLLRAPAAHRERQHHRAGDLADRPAPHDVERPGPRRPAVGDASRPRTVVQGRAHHQSQHPAGVGVRGHDGHRRSRGPDAVRLHPGRGRPARRRHRDVAPLAAADPGRRHGHWLRLGRRPALDAGRHRHPARAVVDRAGRAVRHFPRLQHDDRPGHARDERDRRTHPGHRRPRPRQPARWPAGRRVERHPHRRRPQRRDPGPGRRVSPGRRHVHGDRIRRHRAGHARRRGSRPDPRSHPGGRVRRADRRGRGGDDVHHRRVPARPDPHHLRREPAAGGGCWPRRPS